MEAPGALEVARFPITSVVPVCVVSRCVFTSVAKCGLQRTLSVGARACVRTTPCVEETPCVSGGVIASVPGCVLPSTPCMNETPRVTEAVCVSETVCVNEAPWVSGTTCVNERVRVSEARCVRGAACVRSLCVREMTVGMREHEPHLRV